MIKPLLIAIDGPSASGKGTVAKKIAAHFNLPHLDTGSLYRLVAFRVLQQKIALEDFAAHLDSLTQNVSTDPTPNEELSNEEVGAVASMIAKNPLLRQKLFTLQKQFVENGINKNGGAVLDGRDTTTVICPNANYKFFITADVEIRAKRRFKQLHSQGKNVNYEEILAQLKKRDENDIGRKDSPLLIAQDAIVINNGNLNIEEGLQKCLSFIKNTKT